MCLNKRQTYFSSSYTSSWSYLCSHRTGSSCTSRTQECWCLRTFYILGFYTAPGTSLVPGAVQSLIKSEAFALYLHSRPNSRMWAETTCRRHSCRGISSPWSGWSGKRSTSSSNGRKPCGWRCRAVSSDAARPATAASACHTCSSGCTSPASGCFHPCRRGGTTLQMRFIKERRKKIQNSSRKIKDKFQLFKNPVMFRSRAVCWRQDSSLHVRQNWLFLTHWLLPHRSIWHFGHTSWTWWWCWLRARPGLEPCSGSRGSAAPRRPRPCLGRRWGCLFLLENRHFPPIWIPQRKLKVWSVSPTDRAPSERSSGRTFDVSVNEKWHVQVPAIQRGDDSLPLNRCYLSQSALLLLERRLFTPQARHLLQHTVTHRFYRTKY